MSAVERRKDGACGTGRGYDTSPPKGCCTVTCGSRRVTKQNTRLTNFRALQSAAKFLYANLLILKASCYAARFRSQSGGAYGEASFPQEIHRHKSE